MTSGHASAAVSGTRLTRAAFAQRASSGGLKPSALRAAVGLRIRIGMRMTEQFRQTRVFIMLAACVVLSRIAQCQSPDSPNIGVFGVLASSADGI